LATIIANRLQQRAALLDDAQAEKALAFIDFLLARERLEKERREWHEASEEAFVRLWDNEQDAIYDNWRDLYGVPNT